MRRAFEVTAFCSLLCIAAVMAYGCSGDTEQERESAAIESVTLPPAPPLCDKSPAQLILFAGYHSPACSLPNGGVSDDCLPECGAGKPACPGGAQCVGSAGLQHCVRADCTQNPAICS
jgi:hypothetical protein